MHKLEKLILEAYSDVINEMSVAAIEQKGGTVQWEDISDAQRKSIVKRYGRVMSAPPTHCSGPPLGP